MQARGRLVEHIEGSPGGAPLQFGSEFDPLGFSSREGGRRLPQPHIPQTDIDQSAQVTSDRLDRGEELQGVLDRQIQHLGDGLALVANLQGLPVVAGPVAHLAGHVHVGQEVHLDLDGAFAGTVLAASTLHVEREPTRLIPTNLGLGRFGEEFANAVEDAGVGGGVGPRGATDGRLIDMDALVDVLGAGDRPMMPRHFLGRVQLLGQGRIQDAVDEGGLPRAGYSGDSDEPAQREANGDVAQVVLPGADHGNRLAVAVAAPLRHRNAALPRQVGAGQRRRMPEQFRHRAGDHHLTAMLTGPWADVDGPICGPNRVLVVLHHDEGVAQGLQPQQGFDQPVIVALMQSDGRFVQDVEHSHQTGPDLGGQPDALRFPTGQAAGGA